jgi:uncharacterized protein
MPGSRTGAQERLQTGRHSENYQGNASTMKVHIRQIPPEGLRLEGEEAADFLDPGSQHCRPLSDVRYVLQAGLSGGGLFVTGSLELDVELECVSCLTRFPYPIAVPDFATQIELGGAEAVDLTPYLREDILLALPPYPHCDWDGERTCPAARAQSDAPATAEPPPPQKDAWGALDKLKGI